MPGTPFVALGPAGQAAYRSRAAPTLNVPAARAYPEPPEPDATGNAVVLAATRAFLAAQSRAEVASVLRTAVEDLGGDVIPARLAGVDAFAADVSLGEGEPRLAVADASAPARLLLTFHLPALLEDGLVAAARCEYAQRQTQRAAVDVLTGVATRGEIGMRLGLTQPGDVVCMLDLDGFKMVNDTSGHAAGDDLLREFGALLRASVRGNDFCGRYGGDEFVAILQGAPIDAALRRMTDLAAQWYERNGHATGVSIGLAVVDERGAAAATQAADAALYRAKRLGRNRVELARPDDDVRSATT